MHECKRCGLDESIPQISFNSQGVCNFCQWHDKWGKEHTEDKLKQIVARIKRENKNQKYDVLVGISGGCDSSYMLYKTVELGLRPLAVHWNNNWNTDIAEHNMRVMVRGLQVDFVEITVSKQEYDGLCRDFLLASVPDADIPNDIALTKVCYMIAEKFGISTIFEGHNFRTEGTTPIGWSYMDGAYIKSVHETFGVGLLKTYPNLLWDEWLRYLTILRVKRVRPLWYLHYRKEEAKDLLIENFGWTDYGAQHGENKYTMFVSNYLQPRKFHMDLRKIFLAAQIRSRFVTREYVREQLGKHPMLDESIVSEVKTRLQLGSQQFDNTMAMKVKSHHDYKTYHSLFKKKKALLELFAEENLVPETFLEKYCK